MFSNRYVVDIRQEKSCCWYYFVRILAFVCENKYLCIVFFIVLDLRLTKRLEYSGTPFLCTYFCNARLLL